MTQAIRLARLLLRFWDCPPGAIFLDGQDIRAYRADDVRRPIVVTKGQTVTMEFSVPGVSLTAMGRAMSEGGIGEEGGYRAHGEKGSAIAVAGFGNFGMFFLAHIVMQWGGFYTHVFHH